MKFVDTIRSLVARTLDAAAFELFGDVTEHIFAFTSLVPRLIRRSASVENHLSAPCGI